MFKIAKSAAPIQSASDVLLQATAALETVQAARMISV
jgi:hypothetical protein